MYTFCVFNIYLVPCIFPTYTLDLIASWLLPGCCGGIPLAGMEGILYNTMITEIYMRRDHDSWQLDYINSVQNESGEGVEWGEQQAGERKQTALRKVRPFPPLPKRDSLKREKGYKLEVFFEVAAFYVLDSFHRREVHSSAGFSCKRELYAGFFPSRLSKIKLYITDAGSPFTVCNMVPPARESTQNVPSLTACSGDNQERF
jgi:hypothetical protein